MELKQLFEMFIQAVGGLGLFLLGMKQMSDGMQAIAGEKLRQLISKVTDNRFIACGVGATITGMIQSSSVTTIMVVGMVNAKIMTLTQAIGVIMGGNIGTTVTAWLIALKIVEYGLPILGVSAFFYLFTSKDRIRYIAMMFLGLGMVFFGLTLMKGGFQPLRDNPEFISLLSMFEPVNYWGLLKCIFVGAVTTAIIQSSSATVAITISLASTGVINYETAVALVLGENIGTTITAFLASIGTTTNAKRAAYSHILFNVLGAMIMVPLFYRYVWILNLIFPENLHIAAKIAFAHTGFNLFIVILLIPFINIFAMIVKFLAPDKLYKEKPHLTYLDVRLFETPVLGLNQSYDEIIRMTQGINEMFEWLKNTVSNEKKDKNIEKKIFHREQVYDQIQKELVEFISKIMNRNLPPIATLEARNQLRLADEYESISDYIVNILKMNLRIKNNDLELTKKDKKDIIDLHDSTAKYLNMIKNAIETRNKDILNKALSSGDNLKHKLKTIRSHHLNRLAAEQTTALVSLVFMDMLNAYKRIKEHGLNIAEVIAGEK
jgi:phosphate:Na+ symporter